MQNFLVLGLQTYVSWTLVLFYICFGARNCGFCTFICHYLILKHKQFSFF